MFSGVYYHTAYGLSLAAESVVPGLALLPAHAPADIEIKLRQLPPDLLPADLTRGQPRFISPYLLADGTPVMKMWKGDQGYSFIRYSDGVEFAVNEAGSEIWVRWLDGLSLDHAALFLRGPVMSLVLGLRGFLCLHASAVVIDGRAVGFAGPPGAGKSTTAALFASSGFSLLSDDLLALSIQGETLTAHPAYPRVCLWPESAALLGRVVEDLPRLVPDDEKRFIQLDPGNGSFHNKPAPLGAIYILSPHAQGSCAPGLQELEGAEEIVSLLANNYGTGLLDRERRAKEFTMLGRVVGQTHIRRVRVPRHPARLDEVRELILGDFRAAPPKGKSFRPE
jgi:hypothetical protein